MSPVPARLPAPPPVRVSHAPLVVPDGDRPARPRPHLRLVVDGRLDRAARRRRARRLAVLVGAGAVASLMALATTHAMLVSSQVRLDDLEAQAADAQARHQSLRLEVASLEDPARVVTIATDRLGMIPADSTVYLPPVNPPTGGEPGGEDDTAADDGADAPALPWGAVKPYLGGG